jgi:hypothetical protein
MRGGPAAELQELRQDVRRVRPEFGRKKSLTGGFVSSVKYS